jgi:phage shock protein C
MNKRLYRSRADRKIAGVCSGLAEYFDIDPTLVRIAAIVLIFFHGLGLLAYIIAWIAMPKRPLVIIDGAIVNEQPPVTKGASKGAFILGTVLILIGLLFLIEKFYWWFDFGLVVAIALVLLGISLLVRPGKGEHLNHNNTQPGEVIR